MARKKRKQIFIVIGLTVLLVIAGGLYFHTQNTSSPEPIKVYTAVETKNKPASTTAPHASFGKTSSEEHHAEDAHLHEDGHLHKVGPTTERTSHRTEPESHASKTQNTEDWTQIVEREMLAITEEVHKKYPEVAKLSTLSAEEFYNLYPTEEAFFKLQEQIQQMQGEFMERLRVSFSKVPKDIQKEIITSIIDDAIEKWGHEVAAAIAKALHTELGQ